MAQEPKKEEVAEAPKSKKKLIIIIVAILALAGGGGAAFMMMGKKADAAHSKKAKAGEHAKGEEGAEGEGAGEEEAAEEADAEEEAGGGGEHGGGEHAGPAFMPLETFTVNLMPDPDEKFLQLEITLQMKSAAEGEKLKGQMPAVRNRVLMLLSSKKASDLSTPEGKKALSDELLVELKKPLYEGGKALKVKGVLFTSFVMQ